MTGLLQVDGGLTAKDVERLYRTVMALLPGRFRYIYKGDFWHWNSADATKPTWLLGICHPYKGERTLEFPTHKKRTAKVVAAETVLVAALAEIAGCSREDVIRTAKESVAR